MVFQNPDNQIVANVVEEDVAFGPENLGIASPEIRNRVDKALKQVGMYEYREHAPHLLSGGQKQRLCIARALLKNPKILILDDSSSALDYRTDAALRRALREHYRDTTTVLVAQRISSLRHADLILVLQEGRVIGAGNHRQLMDTCEDYRYLAKIQMDAQQEVI